MEGSAGKRNSTAALLAKKLKIAVIYPDDYDRTTLSNHLKRMGFQVSVFWPVPSLCPQAIDIVFVSCQPDKKDNYSDWFGASRVPLVAILTYESPVFLDYALSIGADAVITTPIRESGLLSAIVVASKKVEQISQLEEKVKRLQYKARIANQIAQAKAILIKMHGLTESQAYDMLRKQAMSKRIRIEEIAQSIIHANEVFSVLAR